MSGIASGVISTCRYPGGVVGISVLALLLSAPASAQSLTQKHQALLVFAGTTGRGKRVVVKSANANRVWLPPFHDHSTRPS